MIRRYDWEPEDFTFNPETDVCDRGESVDGKSYSPQREEYNDIGNQESRTQASEGQNWIVRSSWSGENPQRIAHGLGHGRQNSGD